MTSFEDNFSRQSDLYARHRPRYPADLYAHLASLVPAHDLAWDCATGNGQAATGLAEHFRRVVATDGSADQIANAVPHERVVYRVALAEKIDLDDASADLVTVAQALHWFDFYAFYAGVRRVLKPGGLFAAWTYTFSEIKPDVDQLLRDFTLNIVGDHWPDGIDYLLDRYTTIPFPFEELPAPGFAATAVWTLEDALGYLNSWSATQRFMEAHGRNPVEQIRPALAEAWGEQQERSVRWPLHLRLGRRP